MATSNRTCAGCDGPFTPPHGGQRYCTPTCREQSKWARTKRLPCTICAGPTGYKPGAVHNATCNTCRRDNIEHGTNPGYAKGCRCDDCKTAHTIAHRAYTARLRTAPVTKACDTDGCERQAQTRSMCLMHYKRWARANGMESPPSNAWSDARRSNYHARRARLAGARNGDTVLLTEVIQRDGSNCAGCNQPVDLTLAWPHRLSKSLDHIQPISKGGTHTLTNAQLMHFACNASKGSKTH